MVVIENCQSLEPTKEFYETWFHGRLIAQLDILAEHRKI